MKLSTYFSVCRRWSMRGLLAIATLGLAGGGLAADYPTKPIRFLVGVAPGGGTDFMARLVGQKLNDAWGQPVVVDNRIGATGLIAMELLANAPPDGYTLIVFNVGHMMSAHLARKVAFDPVKSFAPVSLMANGTSMLGVHPSIPAKTMRDFVAYAKSHPGKLSYASGGVGGIQHLATELLKREAGIDLVHVPYKGSGPGTLALLSGQVQVFLTNALALLPHTKSGKVTGLAVTGSKRMKAAPDIPTLAEAGFPSVDVSLWQGMFAPAGTPSAIIDKLSSAIATSLRTPEVTRLLEAQGAEPAGSTPAEFGRFVQHERERWLKVVRDAKITAN
ncbi:MAG: tripartite tricarboxylate transporter substrate binding protein [Betaproteobacteria bacterium]|nr:MAG: tripartite tricarboxylate transporter substrate binding protein [Betaproteobacteria bacterium]